MPLFTLSGSRLTAVKESDIQYERALQKTLEQNLETAFALEFVCSEFSLHGMRIDTVAFDQENKCFVILEYKRDRSFSVVDQGFSYLALMLNNKADFILEYNERTKKGLKRDDVDWSQSRVIFLAHSFTTYQQNAINFKDLPIELWEVRMFENQTLLLNRLIAQGAKDSIKTVTKSKIIDSVTEEVKVYTVEDHLEGINDKIRALFQSLREKILALGDDIEERPKKMYISYRTQQAFVFTHLQQSKIKIHLIVNVKDIVDPKGFARDVTKIGHYGGGVTEVNLDDAQDQSYVMTLIEQSYRASL